jgi:hypothetical protein
MKRKKRYVGLKVLRVVIKNGSVFWVLQLIDVAEEYMTSLFRVEQ